jgi:hypothetical protein
MNRELKKAMEIAATRLPGCLRGSPGTLRASDENDTQRDDCARALMTLTGLLQAAQAQGDEKAATALQQRQMSR